MNFIEFSKTFSDWPLFSIHEILKLYPNFDRKNLVRWQEKGYIKKIRNKWYIFSDKNINEINLFYIANSIYSPSYISFESALSYYNIIPEAVFSVTSATSLKTNKKTNPPYERGAYACQLKNGLIEVDLKPTYSGRRK